VAEVVLDDYSSSTDTASASASASASAIPDTGAAAPAPSLEEGTKVDADADGLANGEVLITAALAGVLDRAKVIDGRSHCSCEGKWVHGFKYSSGKYSRFAHGRPDYRDSEEAQ
jgi:hypothetical protein